MTPPTLPMLRADCPEGPCPHVSCRHHFAVYRILLNGEIMWHPILGRDAERLTEDELVERLQRLPYDGCSLKAADDGGMRDARIADVLGMARQNIDQINAMERFRRATLTSWDRLALSAIA